ncbi:ABC transporter integral membrane subunit [Leifsonia xyli subsp. cynodontis DSM 46306]|uniref:ABC transporter permease n=1 Tax=Leifsonia xyli subsp. cynodontis DSM 46306 TaxID=1389489 RepID=U3P5K8_LEIXC|nr:ABC transporter permease [Leifsonia xyli]AGW41595.1 ABC transporter integral membrane subunit [Leifsonia xyli subsp. cynodontis DSM 46306]
MTTTASAHVHSSLGRLSFPRVIGSEWIKLRSLRSTFWTLASVIVIVIGFSALLSVTIPSAETLRQQAPGTRIDGFVSAAATTGLTFAQLVVAVLGVLVISGEFSTGMIRSSFAAVPRRFPALAAKAITLFLVSFAVGLVSFASSWAIAAALMSAKGYQADLFAGSTLWSILGAAAYLGLVAVFSMGLGTILKASGGGIAAAVGALFVLPIIASIVVGLISDAKWLADAQHYLISNAGSGMAGLANGSLEPWAAAVTVLVWTAVSFVGGALLLQRRDA